MTASPVLPLHPGAWLAGLAAGAVAAGPAAGAGKGAVKGEAAGAVKGKGEAPEGGPRQQLQALVAQAAAHVRRAVQTFRRVEQA